MKNTEQKILDELREIKVEITFIKEHMVDADTILTPEEEKRLDKTLGEFKKGKSIPLEDFKRDM